MCILHFLRLFIYGMYLFIAQNREFSPGFPLGNIYVYIFFFGGGRWGEGREVGRGEMAAIHPRFCGHSAFPGDFLAGELGEMFVFCAVVVTIFYIC